MWLFFIVLVEKKEYNKSIKTIKVNENEKSNVGCNDQFSNAFEWL